MKCIPPGHPAFITRLRWTMVAMLFAWTGIGPAAAEIRYVEGAQGVPLAVADVGNPKGPEILFIHGIGQGLISFRPQLESALAQKYRMVAFDLRGHGASGKPWTENAYTDPAVWAEDVARVMEATGLKRPVVVAWSYGTLVISDFIRLHGSGRLSGLVMVGALGGWVPQVQRNGDTALLAELQRARSLQQSLDVTDQAEAVRIVTGMLTAGHPVAGWTETAMRLGALVPPYAQGPLRKHMTNGNTELPAIAKIPVLAVHGAHDGGEPQAQVDAFLKAVPGAKASRYEDAGHSAFAEDPGRFNRELAGFVDAHWRGSVR
jgi:pimeloyl-ACP methyl ester carboxylesterase